MIHLKKIIVLYVLLFGGMYLLFSCQTTRYRKAMNTLFDQLETELIRSREGLMLCEQYNLENQIDTVKTVLRIEQDVQRVLIHCADSSKYLLHMEGVLLPKEVCNGAKIRHIRRYYPSYCLKDSAYIPMKIEYIAYKDSLGHWQRIE